MTRQQIAVFTEDTIYKLRDAIQKWQGWESTAHIDAVSHSSTTSTLLGKGEYTAIIVYHND